MPGKCWTSRKRQRRRGSPSLTLPARPATLGVSSNGSGGPGRLPFLPLAIAPLSIQEFIERVTRHTARLPGEILFQQRQDVMLPQHRQPRLVQVRDHEITVPDLLLAAEILAQPSIEALEDRKS